MTQYVINIGAIPNDGTGDPLRTAFNETNLNFDQVFAAGPVLSNIQIANNKILTTNTNGNLILAPNGTGVVQANVSIVPNLANLRNLGSATNRWNTVYTQYVDVSGPVSLSQLTVTGNLTVNGNIIQIGNLVTDAKTIQLANTATTANAANGSGITVGANDNIATILYNSTGNTWTTNIGLSSVGNITAPYFVGNGSQLTGISTASTGNLDIVGTVIEIAAGAPETLISISPDAEGWAFLQLPNDAAANTANTRLWNGAGNVEIGSGDLSNSGPSYTWIFDNAGNLTVPANSSINTSPGSDGNINFHPDGSGVVNITGASPILLRLVGDEPNTLNRIEIDTYGNSGDLGGTFTGVFYRGTPDTPEVVQNGDRLSSLKGKGYNGSTIANVSGQITIDAQGTWSNVSNGTHISFWTTPNNSNIIQESARLYAGGDYHQIIGNIVVDAGNISASGNVTGGNISTTGNVTANNFIGLSGNITNLDSLNFTVENIGALVGNNGVNIGAGGNNNLVVLPTEVLIQNVPLTVAGNILSTVAGGLNITANTVANGTAQIWNFGTDGRLTFPGTPRIDTDANNFEVQAAENISLEANAVVNIYTDTSGTTYQWQFDNTGNLTVPGNIIMTTGIVGSGASPAPSLSGFSSVSAVTVSASGNISATGNITAGNISTAGNITGNTAGFAIGYRDIPQVSFTGNATIATTDAGKHFYSIQSSNFTLTIANNASQGFQVGAAITVVNQGTGNITVAQGSGVILYLAGNATSGNRTVATFGMATIMKVATDTWFINGTGVS